jgi:hypothetical protein
LAVCRSAYPEAICPYLPDLGKRGDWKAERDNCFTWARHCRAGLASPPAPRRFDQRPAEFCVP